jgi:hypothetical protein
MQDNRHSVRAFNSAGRTNGCGEPDGTIPDRFRKFYILVRYNVLLPTALQSGKVLGELAAEKRL